MAFLFPFVLKRSERPLSPNQNQPIEQATVVENWEMLTINAKFGNLLCPLLYSILQTSVKTNPAFLLAEAKPAAIATAEAYCLLE